MKTLTVCTKTRVLAGHNSYIDFANQLISTDRKRRYATPPAPKKVMDYPVQFLTAMAHELRNPLTNINLSIGMIESIIKNDDLKTYLDIIMRSSIRINDLITELLKYQQEEDVPAVQYSVHQLLDEVLETAGDRITLKHIEVIKHYAIQDCKIKMNRLRMKIALTNIIINAIEAMTSGKGILKLTTKSVYGKYFIQIEDNGCGISKENMKNIFKPYFTNKQGGLGIGLSTTYEILESDHVEIDVKSKEGEGTRFSLLFDKNYQYGEC